MDFATTKVASHQAMDAAAASVKIVVTGGFGAGKTTFGGDFPHPADDVGEALSVGARVPWLNATPGSGTRPWPR